MIIRQVGIQRLAGGTHHGIRCPRIISSNRNTIITGRRSAIPPTRPTATDLAAREELRREYTPEKIKDELDEDHYAFNIMALTPPDRTEDLLPFLHSKDIWVQARACDSRRSGSCHLPMMY
jgi:hypothetical protein